MAVFLRVESTLIIAKIKLFNQLRKSTAAMLHNMNFVQIIGFCILIVVFHIKLQLFQLLQIVNGAFQFFGDGQTRISLEV